MNTEFIRFTTEDQLVLQGLIYTPAAPGTKAFLHIHGMAGNFYENMFLDVMAGELTSAGYAFFAINTRGHDIIADFPIAGTEEKYKRIGNAYEKFEECVFDIKAAVSWLQKNGYQDIVLCGHSLGSVKAAYYIANTKNPGVNKLILMSPPDMIGLSEKEPDNEKLLAEALKMIAEGRGDELLPVKIWNWYHLSAKTGVSFNTRDNPIDIFSTYEKDKPSALAEIKIPVFAFMGENDDAVIMPPKEALEIIKSKAPNAPVFETDIIEGAPHSYFGREKEMVQRIISWLDTD